MAIISIPGPGSSFSVIIKDSAGFTVYGPTPQTNAPFDTGTLPPDTYTVTATTSDSATNGFCFTVTECECPVVDEVNITLVGGINYYGNFIFDMSGGFICPFEIYIVTDFTTATLVINSLADLTLQSGDIYFKSVLIGGVGYMSYVIRLLDGTICNEGVLTYGCVGVPNYSSANLRNDSGTYYLDVVFNNCSDGGCDDVTINYVQAFPVPGADAGTVTDTIDCGALPYTVSILLAPGATSFGYNLTVINCCENVIPLVP